MDVEKRELKHEVPAMTRTDGFGSDLRSGNLPEIHFHSFAVTCRNRSIVTYSDRYPRKSDNYGLPHKFRNLFNSCHAVLDG